jgi:Ankyrin repeats (3 copies)
MSLINTRSTDLLSFLLTFLFLLLLVAARWGHLDIAKELLHRFPDGIRAMDWEGSLPLHDAARQGQFLMAGLLVEQFPVALCVQNLRGEVPLFPAARSGNIDLVAYLVQAWPEGSKLVLKSISNDDRIDTWNWDILELLLRGAIHHLDEDDCPVLRGRESPTLRLIGDDVIVNATTASHAAAASSQDVPNIETSSKNGKTKKKQKKNNADHQISGTIEDRQARLVDTAAHGVVVIATTNISTTTTPKNTASKRPIHSEINSRKRPLSSSAYKYSASSGKRIQYETLSRSSSTDSDDTVKNPILRCNSSGNSERVRTCHTPIVLWESPQAEEEPQEDDDDLDQTLKQAPSRAPRTFFHLHAALQSGASIHVVAHVLQMRPRDVFQMDENHCYPLHWAAAWAKTADQVNLVLDKIFRPFPRAAWQRTWFDNQLPLHIALKSMGTTNTGTSKTEADAGAAAASERIIKALLQEHPASAVDPCQTRDEWHDQKPLHMACRHDCCVGTLYELLRIDPSLLPPFVTPPLKQTSARGKAPAAVPLLLRT